MPKRGAREVAAPASPNDSGESDLSPRIDGYAITVVTHHLPRRFADSQVSYDSFEIGALELTCGRHTGVGFFNANPFPGPLPPAEELTRVFELEVAPHLIGGDPHALLNRVTRPRGAARRLHLFGEAVDQALWDLAGKLLDVPLYRLLGGTSPRVPAYASGIEYDLSTNEACEFFAAARDQGFRAFKVKVGHPDLEWDVDRLRAVRAVVGRDAVLMADANEAWSAKEAIRRLAAFRSAGCELSWIEDPCVRDDFEGLRAISASAPATRVVCGEYLDRAGKRRLLETGAADILNVHDNLSDGLSLAAHAADLGIPMTVGNTQFEVGVHLAAALPEMVAIEFSFPGWQYLLEEPVLVSDGHLVAPDRPGHGLELSPDARTSFARAE